MRAISLVICLVGFFYSFASFGSNVAVRGRLYIHSCGYVTNQSADVQLRYRNDSLQWGTRVFLAYGLNGAIATHRDGTLVFQPVEWANRTEVEMPAVAPYTWGGEVSAVLRERSSPRTFHGVAFVFRIVMPDGSQHYDNGRGGMSYYRIAFQKNHWSPCVGFGVQKPAFEPMSVGVTVK